MDTHSFDELFPIGNDRLQLALDFSGVGMWELDGLQQKVYLDKRCRDLYGFSEEEEVTYKTVFQYVYSEDQIKVRESMAQVFDLGQTITDIHFRILRSDGQLRWIHTKGKAYFDEQSTSRRFFGVVQDITAQMLFREQAATSEQLAELALEGGNAGWFTIRMNSGELEYSSELARIMTGSGKSFSREELIEHIHPDDRKLRDIAYEESMQTGKLRYQIRFIWDDGSVHWVRVIGTYQYDAEGKPYFFSGIAQDITLEVEAQLQLEASEERFRNIIQQSPMAIGLLSGREMVIEVGNDKLFEFWRKDDSIKGLKLMEALPEIEGQGFIELLQQVYDDGKPVIGSSVLAKLERKGKQEDAYFDFTYTPLRNTDSSVSGVMIMAIDVTEQVLARQKLEESEAKVRSLVENSPVAMSLFTGRDLVIEMSNVAMIKLWGKGDSVMGKPLRYALPELEGQPFLQILDDVFTTGIPYHARESKADLVVDGKLGTYYFNFTYQPLFDTSGNVYAILDVAIDVTEEVRTRKQLEESDLFARSIIYNSPVAKLVLIGEEMIVQTVNENMMEMIGRDNSILGLPLMDAIPELRTTAIPGYLKDVFYTGETFYQPEERIELIRYGQPYTGYYNYIYKALRNTDNAIYGIIVTATEVTGQVQARQKIEEAEAFMRNAVDLAQLGTWSFDPVTNHVFYSQRFQEWFGLTQRDADLNEIYASISPDDIDRIKDAVDWALNVDSGGVFDEEYTIQNPVHGKIYILHAKALTFFDEQGISVKMIGTVRDITAERQIQLKLEQQVQERTEELAVINEELAATNEELATANEDLFEVNALLLRSNDNLEKFAYIASHDLQEPLRKVQSFGDLLKKQYAPQLGEGVQLLERMQSAAGRMSVLIRDLLSFSRVSSQKDKSDSVSLTQVLNTVLTLLELRIEETKATIQVDPLPTVFGDASQLEQLFQNLLSNALKFHKKDVAPIIEIRYQQIESKDLPSSVKVAKHTRYYHQIKVSDNGIGFEEEYAERIFQIFQRLHSRVEYAGTGIGLAICEKVVTNHVGAIIATSQLGSGATFTIFLPFE
ncbi:PAS domain S-box protein [Cytophagaceae bacterium DM2B3-1]|uniref:histidine kinase n=1 Tax=Xanthocytophaga flava TaxID=3048013 RepID=A0ABT7CRE3_9BACT|nr:PAS domain S-box protein [Xanthocytophaga flavus]MDJ1496319.1 PAS domain S-box protein [Xanthocytophaga flavus]